MEDRIHLRDLRNIEVFINYLDNKYKTFDLWEVTVIIRTEVKIALGFEAYEGNPVCRDYLYLLTPIPDKITPDLLLTEDFFEVI